MTTILKVKRAAIAEAELDEAPPAPLAEGEVRAATRDFALTANNITYAVAGAMIGYWQFFPVAEPWGIVPVWGFAEVTESRCPELPVGSRFWGFLPMASDFVLRPQGTSARGFTDGAAHRAKLPAVYNEYQRTDGEPPEVAALADARSLLFPLFMTGWIIADYLSDKAMFGAARVIIGSASSKTGFGFAHYAGQIAPKPEIVGLTSPGNIGFVEGLGLYDKVLAYGDVATLDGSVPSVYVDMSGDGAVLAAVHRHFGDNLKASIGVGATHWDAPRGGGELPGPKPEFFFAPGQIAKRNADWGKGEALRRALAANIAFVTGRPDLVQVRRGAGGAAVREAYAAMAAGRTPPAEGLILSF